MTQNYHTESILDYDVDQNCPIRTERFVGEFPRHMQPETSEHPVVTPGEKVRQQCKQRYSEAVQKAQSPSQAVNWFLLLSLLDQQKQSRPYSVTCTVLNEMKPNKTKITSLLYFLPRIAGFNRTIPYVKKTTTNTARVTAKKDHAMTQSMAKNDGQMNAPLKQAPAGVRPTGEQPIPTPQFLRCEKSQTSSRSPLTKKLRVGRLRQTTMKN